MENKLFIEDFSKENKRLNKHQLDSFETSILTYLQKGLPQQRILPQFDSGTRSDNSKFTDFVIVMKNCIIAIEAKCYTGIIEQLEILAILAGRAKQKVVKQQSMLLGA